jgi:hypothetical protein
VKSNNNYNIDDVAIIDDEAGFAFNNGTIEGEGRKVGPGTELGDEEHAGISTLLQATGATGCWLGAGVETGSCNRDGDRYNGDDQGDDGDGEPEDKLAELIQGQVRTTWVLANDSKFENFCLRFACVDGGDDGYSPLGDFDLVLGGSSDWHDGDDGDDDGSLNAGGGDGDEHHHG